MAFSLDAEEVQYSHTLVSQNVAQENMVAGRLFEGYRWNSLLGDYKHCIVSVRMVANTTENVNYCEHFYDTFHHPENSLIFCPNLIASSKATSIPMNSQTECLFCYDYLNSSKIN